MQYTLNEFIPGFLRLLFEPADLVRIAVGSAGNSLKLPRAQAIQHLLDSGYTPNVWFAASAFSPDGGFTSEDCISTRALCLDIDYTSPAHPKTPFPCFDDAYGYLLTLPIQPTCIWHTGHGIQALYLLDKPYTFNTPDDLALYKEVAGKLARMALADRAFTPEHLYRVPLSINRKPNIKDENGEVLQYAPTVSYSFQDIAQLCRRYDVDPEPVEEEVQDEEGVNVPYEELPEALREDIECEYAEGTRSEALFTLVQKLCRQEYSDKVIQDALSRNLSFSDKYEGRLAAEIDRCISKARNSTYVYNQRYAPLRIHNEPVEIPLKDCQELTEALKASLDAYIKEKEINTAQRVLDSARFHEHLFQEYDTGVIETPCGYGKSTWAKCHIAVNAGAESRYIYVVETVDALYKAAADIEALNPGLKAGRVHGHNEDKCEALCGKRHTYKECRPKSDKEDKGNVCNTCEAREACAFYNRASEEEKPAIVMTHNGFIRLLENASPILKKAAVIIDEDLNGYIHEGFTYEELCLASELCGDAYIEELLPYTSFAMRKGPVKPGSMSYASMHYVYRNPEETAQASAVTDGMRAALRTGYLDPFKHQPGVQQRAAEVVARLINFFRPTKRQDACYAYREYNGTYILKKNRFDLGTTVQCRKLWMLNASARLMPTAYPENMTVYTCSELQPSGHNVMLQVVRGNPTGTKLEKHIETGLMIARTVTIKNRHSKILLCTGKETPELKDLIKNLRNAHHSTELDITHLGRGRIKGSNEAGHCTLAFLASMPLFKSVHDYALSTAIETGRTLPVSHYIKGKTAHMPGGKFTLKVTREIYALSALDELYQTIMRTAVRNDQRVEAIIVVPDAEWVSLLYQTVMPGLGLDTAYAGEFEMDDKFRTLINIINSPKGHEFKKQDLLQQMGYSENIRWQDVKRQVMHILGPFFEEGSSNRVLRRKP